MIGIDDAADGADGGNVEYPENWKPDPNEAGTVAGVVVAGDTPPYDDSQPRVVIAVLETEARIYDPDAPDNARTAFLETGDGLSMSTHGGMGFVNRAPIGAAVIAKCEGKHEVEWAPQAAYEYDTRIMDREQWDNDGYEHADAFRAAAEAYSGMTGDNRPNTGDDGLSTLASENDDLTPDAGDDGNDGDEQMQTALDAANAYVVDVYDGRCSYDELVEWVEDTAGEDVNVDEVIETAGWQTEDGENGKEVVAE